jgi:signal transduction histidine kinase
MVSNNMELIRVEVYDVDVDLQHEAQKVVSIFQNEARMKRIGLNLVIGESINRLGVTTIKTDPVRLGQVYVPYIQLFQVLIPSVTNLLSNGIRFTSTSEVRRIELRFDLSFDPPAEGTCVMPGLPDKAPLLKDDMRAYLYVAVTDTGPGLTPKELDMLFQRFSQVSRESLRPRSWLGG